MSRKDLLSLLIIPSSIILGSFIIAGGIIWSNLQRPVTVGQQVVQTQNQPAQPSVDSSKVSVRGVPYIGRLDAPVTIAYWYDYQCPFCRQNEEATMPSLIKDYVNTGKVKVLFKDYQFLGQDSISIGLVSRAVWLTAPSKFYDWHKAIFDNQGTENSGWATKSKITAITKGVLGQDLTTQVMDKMDKDYAIYLKQLADDKNEGQSYGITSTPTMVVGTEVILGSKPYANLKDVIDRALAAKAK